jgi:hypothetical protein
MIFPLRQEKHLPLQLAQREQARQQRAAVVGHHPSFAAQLCSFALLAAAAEA